MGKIRSDDDNMLIDRMNIHLREARHFEEVVQLDKCERMCGPCGYGVCRACISQMHRKKQILLWAFAGAVVYFSALVSVLNFEFVFEHAVIVPVAFVAAVIANATAIGGGFLFIPLFIFGYGISPVAALKLSIATQAFGMTSGAVGWSKKFIDGQALLIGGGASLFGMAAGSYVWVIPSEIIKPVFGLLSIAIFVAIMLEIRYGGASTRQGIDGPLDGRIVGLILLSFVGGLVTAWVAIGVGEIVALYLLFVYRVRIDTSIGTGVAVLALDSILGLLIHSDLGGVPWSLLAFTVPGVLLGGFTGARLGRYLEKRPAQVDCSVSAQSGSSLKWLFSMVILIDGVSILGHSILMS